MPFALGSIESMTILSHRFCGQERTWRVRDIGKVIAAVTDLRRSATTLVGLAITYAPGPFMNHSVRYLRDSDPVDGVAQVSDDRSRRWSPDGCTRLAIQSPVPAREA